MGQRHLQDGISERTDTYVPNRFVPALELMGYIKDLDFFILEQLLKYMTKWKEWKKPVYDLN